MKTYHKEYGITASITDKLDGTARLLVKDQYGRKVKDSIHKNRSAAADWLKLEDISEEACSELEKTLTAAVMKWLEKHSLKPDFYESISSVQAHGIDDYFKKK